MHDLMHDPTSQGLFAGLLLMSLIHSLIPTHWLSFVLVAKAQGWSRKKMLKVVLFSGLGHVTTTTLVGLLAALFGKAAHAAVERLETPLPAMILFVFGLYYIVVGWRKGGHRHCTHDHTDDPIREDRIAVSALFLEMTLSPCETLIPVFFAAGFLPWPQLILMAVVTSLVTLLVMCVLSWVGHTGYSKIRLPWLENNERILVGLLLAGLGVLTYFLH